MAQETRIRMKHFNGTDYDVEYPDTVTTSIQISIGTSWQGNASPYSQAITVNGGTQYTKVDLQPNVNQITQLEADGTTGLVVQNNNGVFTIYAFGGKPTTAMNVQATLMEVWQE